MMTRWGPREIVERLGPHPTALLAIDLATEEGVGRWWIAVCLLSLRIDEGRALEAFRSLARAGLGSPATIAESDLTELEAALGRAGLPRPDRVARTLARGSAALTRHPGTSLESIAEEAESSDDLASRLVRITPGIGAATVAAFLRPLRDHWALAGEVPLGPAARAAALHLGLLREGEDEEGEPGALRAVLMQQADPPALSDVEAALTRLGRRACLRGHQTRCPLGSDCPARSEPTVPAPMRRTCSLRERQ